MGLAVVAFALASCGFFLDNGNSTGFDPTEATTKTKFAARRTAIAHT